MSSKGLVSNIVTEVGAWRGFLLIGVYLIWVTKPLWIDRGHHFDYGFIFVLVSTYYLYTVLLIFAVELGVALARMRRISRLKIGARVLTLLAAALPSVIARVLAA